MAFPPPPSFFKTPLHERVLFYRSPLSFFSLLPPFLLCRRLPFLARKPNQISPPSPFFLFFSFPSASSRNLKNGWRKDDKYRVTSGEFINNLPSSIFFSFPFSPPLSPESYRSERSEALIGGVFFFSFSSFSLPLAITRKINGSFNREWVKPLFPPPLPFG